MIPVYGFLEGDTIGLLVLADEHETVADMADKLLSAARLRAGIDGPIVLLHAGREIDPELTVEQAGIKLLDRIDVRRRASPS